MDTHLRQRVAVVIDHLDEQMRSGAHVVRELLAEAETASARVAKLEQQLAEAREVIEGVREICADRERFVMGGPASILSALLALLPTPPKSDPACPQCGGELERIRYRGGYMNRDQWESQRAGDWCCTSCPDNDRAKNGACYWWDREVYPAPPKGGDDEE